MARKQNKDRLGAGGIIALVVAALALIGILAGVAFYIHNGNASAGTAGASLTAEEPVTAVQKTTKKDKTVAGEEADKTEKAQTTKTKTAADASKKATKTDENTPKDKETTKKKSTGSVPFKSKATAKQLAKYYNTDVDAFRDAYEGKTVTVTGKLSDKSAKMLYVDLATGAKVPLRVYLNSEDQREEFNAIETGTTITVKGNVGVLYPMDVDAGGFQEMANGLIALDSVTLVK